MLRKTLTMLFCLILVAPVVSALEQKTEESSGDKYVDGSPLIYPLGEGGTLYLVLDGSGSSQTDFTVQFWEETNGKDDLQRSEELGPNNEIATFSDTEHRLLA